LGQIHFPACYYVYIGSALNGIEKRVSRHFSTQKKHHWHIDYFLDQAVIRKAFVKQRDYREECEISEMFSAKFSSIPHFGSSDCNCLSHLFYGSRKGLEKTILEAGLKDFKQNDL
jgi:Uri superfamily endonuclease